MNITRIHNYICGECSAEEQRSVGRWIDKSQENKELLNLLRELWEVEPKDEFQPDMAEGYRNVRERLQQSGRDGLHSDTNHGASPKREELIHHNHSYAKSYLRVAAAVLMLLAVILFVIQSQMNQSKPEPLKLQEIQTERGERTSFTLADGSRVLLNADSKLEIASTFDTDLREVYLQGEAYFDVASDPERPFVIYSKHAYIHVLGTKFGTSAYPDAPNVQTVVEEGRVLFGTQSDSNATQKEVELGKKEFAEAEENGIITQKQLTRSMAQYLGWKEGKLVFEKTPLERLIPKLERWYDITMDLQDSALGERLLTATFQDEPLTEVLKVISLSLDLKYKRVAGKKIVFTDAQSTS